MKSESPTLEPRSGLHYNKLHAPVRSYIDKLRAQVYEVFKKYDVADMKTFIARIRRVKPEDWHKVNKIMEAMEVAYRNDETPEFSKEFLTVREKELKILSDFFEEEIDVPPLPSEITPERLKVWESQGLKMHYLPDEYMESNRHLKNWKSQPDFKKYLNTSKLSRNIMRLKGDWVLVDTRRKPAYADGNQMYNKDSQGRELDDFLGPVLEELRQNNVIDKFKNPRSRFKISPEELEYPEVIAAFADVYGVKPKQVALQSQIEFNIVGNMHHPEWGEPPSDCLEWFSDKYEFDVNQLCGGDSNDGGLSFVNYRRTFANSDRIGFRLIIRFPQNKLA